VGLALREELQVEQVQLMVVLGLLEEPGLQVHPLAELLEVKDP